MWPCICLLFNRHYKYKIYNGSGTRWTFHPNVVAYGHFFFKIFKCEQFSTSIQTYAKWWRNVTGPCIKLTKKSIQCTSTFISFTSVSKCRAWNKEIYICTIRNILDCRQLSNGWREMVLEMILNQSWSMFPYYVLEWTYVLWNI